jgi:hypothetical protein
MTNANCARQVVFELFQDLDRFNLGDYRKYDDEGRGMQRLITFLSKALKRAGTGLLQEDSTCWSVTRPGMPVRQFTSDRERALQDEKLELLGLEHALVRQELDRYAGLEYEHRACVGRLPGVQSDGILTIWKVTSQAKDGHSIHHVVRLAMTPRGERAPWLERLRDEILGMTSPVSLDVGKWNMLALQNKQRMYELLHRELEYLGIIDHEKTYSAQLISMWGIQKT